MRFAFPLRAAPSGRSRRCSAPSTKGVGLPAPTRSAIPIRSAASGTTKEDPFYTETGVASWYNSDFTEIDRQRRTLRHGHATRISRCHTDNRARHQSRDGRSSDCASTIGSLCRDGFSCLAAGGDAARISGAGTARVRVQYEGRAEVGAAPPQHDGDIAAARPADVRAAPVAGVSSSAIAPPPGATAAPPRETAPPVRVAQATPTTQADASIEPDGVVTTVPVPATTRLWVQVGAFLARGNADRLAQRMLYIAPAQVSQTAVTAGRSTACGSVRSQPWSKRIRCWTR
jgi:hypothetical protein